MPISRFCRLRRVLLPRRRWRVAGFHLMHSVMALWRHPLMRQFHGRFADHLYTASMPLPRHDTMLPAEYKFVALTKISHGHMMKRVAIMPRAEQYVRRSRQDIRRIFCRRFITASLRRRHIFSFPSLSRVLRHVPQKMILEAFLSARYGHRLLY